MSQVGKPILIDRMNAELAPRIVELIIEDTERAQARKKRKKAEKKAARAKKSATR